MKRAVIIALIVLVLALFASATGASVVTETGLSVLFSVGDEKRPIEALVYFFGADGAPITRNENVIVAAENEPVNVQVYPKGATGPKDFVIGYSTDTIMPKHPKTASFTEKYGWCFQLTAEETSQSSGYIRALQLKLTDKDGKHSWFRAIFKVTDLFGAKSNTQYDQIIIKTVPREQLNASNSGSGSGATVAVDALVANQTKTAGYINQLEGRVTNIEQYLKGIAGGNSTPVSASQTMTFPVNFTGNFIGVGMKVTRSDGKTEGYVIKTNSQMLSLPIGKNTIDLMVAYDGGVLQKMKPIEINVSAGTKVVNIDIGGSGR